MIPSASKIIDSGQNVWTVSGGVIYENGATAGTTRLVVLLLYYGGLVFQENVGCQWWYWDGSGWIAAFDPVTGQFEDYLRDASGAVITIPGLWGIAPGNDGSAGSATALYFAAGGTGEASGVLGNLSALQNPQGNDQ